MSQNSYPRAQQPSVSPSPAQHLPVNQPPQQVTPTSRVIARSPNPTSNNQRFDGEGINRNRNDVYHFSKPDISREDQIKKILNKISECYEYPEKRFKTQADIKLDLDYLRRLEDVERGNNSERGRSDRKWPNNGIKNYWVIVDICYSCLLLLNLEQLSSCIYLETSHIKKIVNFYLILLDFTRLSLI